jgi:hypothetical protein
MSPRDRRRVLIGLALTIVALFGAGVAYWIVAGQHHQICSDGKMPLQQQDQDLGQIIYRCHNGQIVTGSNLP